MTGKSVNDLSTYRRVEKKPEEVAKKPSSEA